MYIINKLVKFSNFVCDKFGARSINFEEFLEHFAHGLAMELDFKSEVINNDKTKSNFRDFDSLHVPDMHHILSSKRTIVMEFIEGDKIDDVDTLNEKYGDATKCTNILIDIWAKMVFNDGHIHCDAHPGNIMVRPHPKDPKRPQIVLIDHGFYAKTSK